VHVVPGRIRSWRLGLCLLILCGQAGAAIAQTVSHRGFVEGMGHVFPQTTINDDDHVVGDLLAREELFVRPAEWMRLTAGLEWRANSHSQVEDSWSLRYWDRGRRRPRLAVRTLSATVTRGLFTLDAGKQFIRWGKTDIVVPTDRFSPRDYLTVFDAPFLAVTGVRGTAQLRSFTIEAVWVPQLTPSRTPLLSQRWAGQAAELAATVPIVEGPTVFPSGAQAGVRFGQVAGRFEYSATFYDGFNHLPDFHVNAPVSPSDAVELERVFPPLRTYGGDAVVPLPWFSIKAESAYFTSSSPTTDEYVLYVLQLERQRGEWAFVGGYAGEVVTRRRSPLDFSPDRGLSRSIVARASYTLDANRSASMETAVRQNGDGVYAKAEYSHGRGQHWRATLTGVVLAGDSSDFIGQYDRNSHVRLTVRFSY
jgi:hypothetical protein